MKFNTGQIVSYIRNSNKHYKYLLVHSSFHIGNGMFLVTVTDKNHEYFFFEQKLLELNVIAELKRLKGQNGKEIK
jgi:hypothetical protein